MVYKKPEICAIAAAAVVEVETEDESSIHRIAVLRGQPIAVKPTDVAVADADNDRAESSTPSLQSLDSNTGAMMTVKTMTSHTMKKRKHPKHRQVGVPMAVEDLRQRRPS